MFALKPREERGRLLPGAEYPLRWMPEEFSTLFNRLFAGWPPVEEPEWMPGWNVTTEEKEKEVVIRAELPGFEAEEVKLEVKGERLTIEAEHKEPAEKTEKKEEKTERAYAHVKRMMTLPPTVELEKAEAVYRNGVLEVRLPRKPEAMGHRIEVRT